MRAESCTWRLISLTEDDSSSVAEATELTLVDASSEAEATRVDSSCERTAVDVSVEADASSWVEAEETVWMISPTALSKLSGRGGMLGLCSWGPPLLFFCLCFLPLLR